MSEAVRSRRGDTRQEPQFASPQAGPADHKDPLAELARLVGQDDPFRGMFQERGAAAPKPTAVRGYAAPSNDVGPTQAYEEVAHDPHFRPSLHEGDAEALVPYDEHHQGFEHQDGYEDGLHGAYHPPAHSGRHEPHSIDHGDHADREQHAEQGYAEQGDPAHEFVDQSLTPDLWAEGAHASEAPPPVADDDAGPRRPPRRPLVVLAAVLLLTGGGLAATFLARTGPASGSGKAAPTILAANGPNKVKLDDPAATAPEDADAALLNKNGGKTAGPAKVVTSQEQPIDLAQLPNVSARDDAGGAPAAAAPSNSPFPEPKRVKTFLVRSDGTMIGNGVPATPAPVASPAQPASPARPAAVPDAIASLPIGLMPTDMLPPPAAARPATPKTTTRAATTPKVALQAPPAGDVAPTPATPGKARQPASAGVHALAKPKPTETAEADPGTTASTGGAFGLQLAAAPSEQEARDIFSRLQRKYADQLGGMRPSVRKAESGDKSVFRLRVGSLSQDEAKSLCSKLQASGGTCFVVHN